MSSQPNSQEFSFKNLSRGIGLFQNRIPISGKILNDTLNASAPKSASHLGSASGNQVKNQLNNQATKRKNVSESTAHLDKLESRDNLGSPAGLGAPGSIDIPQKSLSTEPGFDIPSPSHSELEQLIAKVSVNDSVNDKRVDQPAMNRGISTLEEFMEAHEDEAPGPAGTETPYSVSTGVAAGNGSEVEQSNQPAISKTSHFRASVGSNPELQRRIKSQQPAKAETVIGKTTNTARLLSGRLVAAHLFDCVFFVSLLGLVWGGLGLIAYLKGGQVFELFIEITLMKHLSVMMTASFLVSSFVLYQILFRFIVGSTPGNYLFQSKGQKVSANS